MRVVIFEAREDGYHTVFEQSVRDFREGNFVLVQEQDKLQARNPSNKYVGALRASGEDVHVVPTTRG